MSEEEEEEGWERLRSRSEASERRAAAAAIQRGKERGEDFSAEELLSCATFRALYLE
jgi:hypothetical protein